MRVLVCAVFLCLWTSPAIAQSLTVLWDPSPDPTVAGYIVYVGTSPGNYEPTYDVGAATSFPWTGPVGNTYYFAVASYLRNADGSQLIGPKSPEVFGTIAGPPPPPPPETCAADGTGNGVDEDKDGLIDEICLPIPPPPPPTADTEIPSVSMTIGRRTGNNYPVTITASDNVGIEHVEIWVDGEMQVRLVVPTPSTSFVYPAKVLIKFSGPHVVVGKAFDPSQNIGTASATVKR